MTRDEHRDPFIEAERRKMIEAKTIKDAKRIRESAQMTRDEHRYACIKAIRYAIARELYDQPNVDALAKAMTDVAIAAFDSLRGAGARVVPVEATEEMILPVVGHECRLTRSMANEAWRRMSAVGDLTNPPEGKA